MNGRRAVPDVYNDLYYRALERGMDDDSAAWHAEMILQQMAETPELPKGDDDGE